MSDPEVQMHCRRIACLLAMGIAATLTIPPAFAQTPADPDWTVPRTPDGRPELQGLWSYATITPLERPADLADKEFFTEEEARAWEDERLREMNMDRRDGTAAQDVSRAYNDFWWDRGNSVVSTLRTSLVIDPPDGRIPLRVPGGRGRGFGGLAGLGGRYDGPEDRPLAERCILLGSGGAPMVPTFYNNNVQLFQTGDHVVLVNEMIHDARIVPLTPRSGLPEDIRLWLGDSQGYWDGDTLVVETTHFNDRRSYQGAAENLHLTERFTRTGEDTLLYQFTIDDPTVYTRPWTVEIPLWRNHDLMYEYACHEGNEALAGVLAGARAREAAAAEEEDR